MAQDESSTPAAQVQVADEASEPEAEAEEIKPLTIGDDAPPLKVAEWVHGTPVEGFKKDHIYVVEFWATWCGPCRASMPHMSQLQEEYKDRATFVGVSNEETGVVKEFLGETQNAEEEKTWADILSYNLAMDAENAMSNTYMRAAEQNGIPCAFLVGRDAKIEWIGHPMELDDVLAKVDKNEWDRQAAKEALEKEKQVQEMMREAALAMRAARQSGDWEPALAALEKAMELMPEHAGLQLAHLTALVSAEKHEQVADAIKKLREAHWDDAGFLNALAWELVTRVPKEFRDLDVAQEIASRADELLEGKDASTVDTLARIAFEKGEIENAITLQKKAIELMPAAPQLKRALDEYEKALQERDQPKEEGGEEEKAAE
jgi:thiol-disulfide isomerase/thioredoxin